MQLIQPSSLGRRQLEAGDIVVIGSHSYVMVSDMFNGTLTPASLDGGSIGAYNEPGFWPEYWGDKCGEFTVYPADEWALKLVRKGDVE